MKSLMVKTGKAVDAVKREGIVAGGRRVVRALFGMFRRVGSGDILFITGGAGAGASSLYRCHNQREELERHGFTCAFTVQENPFLISYAKKFKVFIFHRPLMDAALKKLVAAIKEQKGKIIFETDDLLFDPQYFAQADYLKNINPLEAPLYQNGLGADLLNDPYVEHCVTTTSFLADKLREKGKHVFISTNKLSDADLRLAEEINQKKKPATEFDPQKPITIGYFSGSASHDKDFATVANVLVRILGKHPNVQLQLAGSLEIGELFGKFGDRIVRLPYADRAQHFQNIANVDINIAPLEIGNPFCEAKSELKFFEAGIVEVPTVAAATQTFREAIADKVDGFIAHSEEEWEAILERLIADRSLRQRLGFQARKKVLERYTNQSSNNEQYYSCLLKFVYGKTCSI